jgi:hypothetical protein
VTAARRRRHLSQPRAPNPAGGHGFSAAGWRVTSPPSCPKIRAISPAIAKGHTPRVARDKRARRSPPRPHDVAAAVAARPLGGPESEPHDDGAPIVHGVSLGTPPRTPSAIRGPSARRGTICGTRCNAVGPASCDGVDHDPAVARRRLCAAVDHLGGAGWITPRPPLTPLLS